MDILKFKQKKCSQNFAKKTRPPSRMYYFFLINDKAIAGNVEALGVFFSRDWVGMDLTRWNQFHRISLLKPLRIRIRERTTYICRPHTFNIIVNTNGMPENRDNRQYFCQYINTWHPHVQYYYQSNGYWQYYWTSLACYLPICIELVGTNHP